MGERSGVLIQNERQANRAVAKVMRITFLIFTLVYILNIIGIFVVDMGIMTLAYVAGTVFFMDSYIDCKCEKVTERLCKVCSNSLRNSFCNN